VTARLRVGTRGSALALWQTEHVRARLHQAGCVTDRIEIRTTGDLVPHVPLAQIGSRALFTKQIDDAMLEGRIDLAVHSLKDLPTTLPAGIALVAVGEREDPRDALVGHGPLTWSDRRNAVLDSPARRRSFTRPDLDIRDIRGNVDPRLAAIAANPDWTGILLAAAGLVRLGFAERIGQRLPAELMLPAPGQGALAVTARSDDAVAAAAAARAVHHRPTALAVAAERAFLRTLVGGCQVPVAAHAELMPEGDLRLHGRVVSLRGERAVEGVETGAVADERAADALGAALAERLLDEGAASILAEVRAGAVPAVPEP
jgi:hydroxymethylbilane synthase